MSQPSELEIKAQPVTNILGKLTYIQEFYLNGYRQWLCPDCGYTNVQVGGEIDVGRTMWCDNCHQSWTRSIGVNDGAHEIIPEKFATKICKPILKLLGKG